MPAIQSTATRATPTSRAPAATPSRALEEVRRGETDVRRGDIGADVKAVQELLNQKGAGLSTDGNFGGLTKAAVKDFQRQSGLKVDGVVGKKTLAALERSDAPAAPSSTDAPTARPTTQSSRDGRQAQLAQEASIRQRLEGGAQANPPTGTSEKPAGTDHAAPQAAAPNAANPSSAFTPNDKALARAEQTAVGKQLNTQAPKHAATYQKASELTGVPANLIAAIHGQESGFGTYRPSTKGPESGFGLDPRSVSTSWGNQVLKDKGLGTWQRGKDTPTGRLQSAVIAAEHLKRNAKAAGVDVTKPMDDKQLAAAATSYIAGPNSKRTKAALQTGQSFVFHPGDQNPHPMHPGGTSIGRDGRKIRVPPGRKESLLRWDVMLPMIDKALVR